MTGKGKSLRERQLIGRRIRRRRLLLKMTQGALAKALGLSFQMIQTYENGKIRVPEQRLQQLCHHLDVSPDYFSIDGALIAGPDAEALEYFLLSPEGMALYRALSSLPDAGQRSRLVMAVGAFCDSQSRPEDKSVRALADWLRQLTLPRNRQKEAAQAAIRALKVEVAQLLGSTLKARSLTQTFAARILKADQGRISALSRGRVEGSSLDRLLRFLLLLGWDAELRLVRRPLDRRGKLEIKTDSRGADAEVRTKAAKPN
jgi:transcriptional regulator with XRE-family HTH domain/predicted XRE-type DNA-binding protein